MSCRQRGDSVESFELERQVAKLEAMVARSFGDLVRSPRLGRDHVRVLYSFPRKRL